MATSRITGSNENVQTFGNGTRDFTSVATWEAATDNDLVTATQSEVLECYDDVVYDESFAISGATTDTSFFRIIRPATGEGHDGTASTGVRFFRVADAIVCRLLEDNASLQDIVGRVTNNSAAFRQVFTANATNCSFIGCIADSSLNSGSSTVAGFSTSGSSSGVKMIDCLSNNNDHRGFSITLGTGTILYNCTATNNVNSGFNIGTTSSVQINCLGAANTLNDFAGTAGAGSTTNASSDATALGTSPRINQTFAFVNASTDLHLTTSDAGARNFGTDLSADGTFAFDDDIDGELFGTWDIGCDEPGDPVVAGGSSGHLFKRRRRLTHHRGY